MSENLFSEIADQLRNQNPVTPAEQPAVEQQTQPVEQNEPVQEVVQETVQQPVQEVEQEPAQESAWWDSEPQAVEQKIEAKKTEEPTFELDDDLKLIMEYKKSGKTLNDFINEYKVEDISKWSDEQLVKNGLKEFMGLEGEEYEQASYEFDQASILQKKQWAESFRQQFDKRNEDKLKQLTSSNYQQAEFQKAVAEKYNTEVDEFSKKIVGQEMYGLKITDEMSNNLKTFIDQELTFQRADGSFDVEKMYSIGLWLKYGKDLVKANVTKARNEGKEQIIKEVSNPSKNMTGGGRTVGSGLEAAQEAFNTLFQS